MTTTYEVVVPLTIGNGETTAALVRQLERICPRYRPRQEPQQADRIVFAAVTAGSEQVAVGKAIYWLRRAVQHERLRFSSRLVGEVTCARCE